MTTNSNLMQQSLPESGLLRLAETNELQPHVVGVIAAVPADTVTDGEVTNPVVSTKSDHFDDDDLARGDRVRRIVALTVLRAVFEVGLELSAAFHKFDEMKVARGRNSKYGAWLQRYLPAFDRKTLDRWRTAYEKFAPLVKQEIETGCLDYFNHFQLTAVYDLCISTVTEQQRREALCLAKAGVQIGTEQVAQILRPPTSEGEMPFQRTISLPAGQVLISINHDDFRQALQEAIWELDGVGVTARVSQ